MAKMKKPTEECPPMADKYINPQDDNWGLKQNVCPVDSNKINTQDNSHAIENANLSQRPVYSDSDSPYIARSTSQGRK